MQSTSPIHRRSDVSSVRNIGLRPFVFAFLVSCTKASGTEPGPNPCPPVTFDICRQIDEQLERGRRTITESEGGAGFKLNFIGISGSGRHMAESVALSPEVLQALNVASLKCSAAVNQASAYNLDAYHNGPFWQVLNPGQERCEVVVVAAPPSTPLAPLPGSIPRVRGGDGVSFDLDLGVPVGVHVGYGFGGHDRHAVGVRAGVGVGLISGSPYAVGMVGAFGRIGVDENGVFGVEPSLNFAATSSAGFTLGLDARLMPRHDSRGGPGVGVKGGAQVGAIFGSVSVVPDAALVLAW